MKPLEFLRWWATQEKNQRLIDAVMEVLAVEIPLGPDVEVAMLRLGIAPEHVDDQLSQFGSAIAERIWFSSVVEEACEEVFGQTCSREDPLPSPQWRP